MSYRQRVIRTIRCQNKNVIGMLAKVISAISSLDGDIGDIRTVTFGTFYNIRDITVAFRDQDHVDRTIRALNDIPEVTILAIIDEVMELHRGGKLQILPRYPVKSTDDLQKVYTPGVAAVSTHIQRHPEAVREYTIVGKTVAIITNGSRVLGLGNIGPQAAMPVMEGKAALFAQFSGLYMIPVLCNTLDVDLFVETVVSIADTFAAIQLEDIRTPECFEIEKRLIERLSIPVMHDDQHGTAVVSLAATINACRSAGIDLKKAAVGQIGLGAAGSAIARLIMAYTGNPVYGADLQTGLLERFKAEGGSPLASNEEIMQKADVVIATTGKPDIIKPEMVRKGQIILALSNPYPEISIVEAINAGAAFASDGSRVNNLLGYPGILKGAIASRAKRITREMYLAAVEAIVAETPQNELIPDPINPVLHEKIAAAVAKAAKGDSPKGQK